MNFFEFWWKCNALKYRGSGEEEIYGFIFSALGFWVLELIILWNLPNVILGLFKLMKG